MMKICIMGNSHVGALKGAWDAIKHDYPKHKITFFAQRGVGLNGLIVQEGKLIPNNELLAKALEFTSGGKKEIDPKESDVFLIYGLDLQAYFLNEQQFYSKAVIEKTLNDYLMVKISFKLLKKLRSLTDKSVLIAHCPLVAAKDVSLNIPPTQYLAGIKLLNDIIYHPFNAELINQPLHTIVNGKHTHPDFSKNSKRLEIGDNKDGELHPENDMAHMNDAFGEIWLRAFFNHLKIADDKIL